METLGFMAPASFVKEGGPSYCGTQGATSSIDQLPGTKGSAEAAWQGESASVAGASDTAGAVSTGAGPLSTADGAPPCRLAQSQSSVTDNCVEFKQAGGCTTDCRVEFLEDLHNTLQREKGNIEKHTEERAPDNHRSAWMMPLQSVALRHFSRDKGTECEVTKGASLERRDILVER